jgi:hypothetical protein
MQGGERTFQVDRILTMNEDDRNGKTIEDIEAFLTEIQLSQQSKKTSSAKDLANLALDDSETPPVQQDATAELRKLKSLLDDGIITQEDFDAKKTVAKSVKKTFSLKQPRTRRSLILSYRVCPDHRSPGPNRGL